MTTKTVTIEVDGISIAAAPGAMLIEATDAAGINIPRFCYHRKLSVAANCRMCLVDVEKAPKAVPACATPVVDGMKVSTRSERAKAAQQDVMAFLLINHPLDCPICDQGGECELQDNAVSFGHSRSAYAEVKRVVKDKDIGPLIETEMTRCIQCTRCVRFGEEIAGLRELGATGRGDTMAIGTFVEQAVTSELSGNVIDLCPVGALTAKPSRYQARAWEMQAHDSIGPHDAVGSALSVHTFDGRVIRVVPRQNEAINECWISDRDRFSYQGLSSQDRLLTPQIKRDGQWYEVSWQQALDTVVDILQETAAEQVGVLASPTATLEELFLLQKLMRGLGVSNIDHRLQQVDCSDQERMPLMPGLGMSIEQLEQQQAVLLIGANLRQEQPMLNHRLRKVSLSGGHVMAVNPRRVDFNYAIQQQVVTPRDMVTLLADIAVAASQLSGRVLPEVVAFIHDQQVSSEAGREFAATLLDASDSLLMLGNMAGQHPEAATLRALATIIAELTDSVVAHLPDAANSAGAALAGVLPHRREAGVAVAQVGLHTQAMLTAGLQTFVLLNAEADDLANPYLAAAAFREATQVIAISAFANEQMRDCASVLLPAAAFTETSGTLLNAEGAWQSFRGIVRPAGEARPAWKILRVLGNRLGVADFDYVSAQEITAELRIECQLVKEGGAYQLPIQLRRPATPASGQFQRVGDVHMYRSDALVRRATALQAMIPTATMSLHPLAMQQLGFDEGELIKAEQGEGSVQLPVVADDAVPVGAVWIPSGSTAANTLGDAFGMITLSRE